MMVSCFLELFEGFSVLQILYGDIESVKISLVCVYSEITSLLKKVICP